MRKLYCKVQKKLFEKQINNFVLKKKSNNLNPTKVPLGLI